MGLVKGNITANDTTAIGTSPNTATITTHTQNTGADGLIVAVVFYTDTNTVTGVTWDGVAMTSQIAIAMDDTDANLKYSVWYLVAPATGNKNLIYTFSSGGGNATSLITSFTGAAQTSPLQSLNSVPSATPNSKTITISANSMLMAIGTSRWSFDGTAALTIDGTAFGFGACDIDTSVSSAQVCAQTRNANLTAGSKTVITDTIADSFWADNTRIEIKESAGGGGSGIKQGNFLPFFYQ